MNLSLISLAFEAVLAMLLTAMIFYAIRLNRRMVQLRAREGEMRQLIANFNHATAQAATSAASLKAVGADAEKSLRGNIEKAQALRDDLMFIVDRGEGLAARMTAGRSRGRAGDAGVPAGSRGRATAPAFPRRNGESVATPIGGEESDPAPAAGSRSERELVRAFLSARSGEGR